MFHFRAEHLERTEVVLFAPDAPTQVASTTSTTSGGHNDDNDDNDDDDVDHCTICSFYSTIALYPKTEIQKPLSHGKNYTLLGQKL